MQVPRDLLKETSGDFGKRLNALFPACVVNQSWTFVCAPVALLSFKE